MVLGGECRSLRTPISSRYPVVELLSAAAVGARRPAVRLVASDRLGRVLLLPAAHPVVHRPRCETPTERDSSDSCSESGSWVSWSRSSRRLEVLPLLSGGQGRVGSSRLAAAGDRALPRRRRRRSPSRRATSACGACRGSGMGDVKLLGGDRPLPGPTTRLLGPASSRSVAWCASTASRPHAPERSRCREVPLPFGPFLAIAARSCGRSVRARRSGAGTCRCSHSVICDDDVT